MQDQFYNFNVMALHVVIQPHNQKKKIQKLSCVVYACYFMFELKSYLKNYRTEIIPVFSLW